jgi:hypothetical protein
MSADTQPFGIQNSPDDELWLDGGGAAHERGRKGGGGMTIGVELTRSVDGPDVLAVLAENGFEGRLADDGLGLLVESDDAARVARLVDWWAEEHGLPFVAVQVDATTYALVPPAG